MVLITYTTCFDRFNLFFRDPTQKLLYISTSLWPKLVLKSSAIASSSIVMAQVVVLMAGLLLIAESQASDLADRSKPQGFLSKYVPSGTDNSQASEVADRSTPRGFLSKYVPSGSDASQSSMSDYDSFITPNFIVLISLLTMLVIRLRRGLQPATTFASSGGLGLDMPTVTASNDEVEDCDRN